MVTDLPAVLDTYYAAQNRLDIDAMLGCFTTDAHVQDEGRDYHGQDQIRGWMETTSAKYRPRLEALEIQQSDAQAIVGTRVSGSFPGSPINLTYAFDFASDGLIGSLVVH